MAYLPPPPPPPAPRRRPPRWSTTPALAAAVQTYRDGNVMAARRIRRILAAPLAELAEASLGTRRTRHAVAQTAVSRGFAVLEDGLHTAPVAIAFTAVAWTLAGTDRSLLPWLADLQLWERALLRMLDVELADPDGFARALGLAPDDVRHARTVVSGVVGLSPPRESDCPGWSAVRSALRADDGGALDHRATCGRCTLVAEQTVLRRRRLWRPDEVPATDAVGQLAAPFEPRVR